MRSKFVFMLGFLAVLPAYSAVNLPVVDVTSGAVSARSAFGETSDNAVTVRPVRNVVARKVQNKKSDTKQIVKNAEMDILSPNLPSSNLWTATSTPQVDTPLRMPRMDEFAVINDDFMLPDEDLDSNFIADNDKPVTRSQVAKELESTMNRMAEIDAQIAKLSELQRRANNSVKQSPRTRFAARNVPETKQVENTAENTDVKISRTVVPMDEPEMLIRSVERHSVNNTKPAKRGGDGLADLSPAELRKAFRKTFLSENKHLSAMRDSDAYDMGSTVTTGMAGFTAESNLSEMGSKIRPFEIKVSFRNSDSALSRENYTLLTTFAGIIVNNPKRAVQVLIPKDATVDSDDRKLTARRLAIVEQVLRDTGVPEQRILPVLSNRDDDGGLVLRNIDSTQYETLTKQQRNQFGKTTEKQYKSMTW